MAVSAHIAFVFAYIYAYLVLYIPLAGYVTVILSAGFGLLTGGLSAETLKWQKTRNTIVGLAATAVVMAIAYDASWATWIYAIFRRAAEKGDTLPGLLDILRHPALLWAMIQLVNKAGAWTIRGMTPTGGALWCCWLLEAALIFGGAFWVAHHLLNDAPFCERCEKWCKGEEGVCRVSGGDVDEMKRRAEQKDFESMGKQGGYREGAPAWFRLDLHTCPACRVMNTLTVKQMTLKVDKQGKASTEEKTIVAKLQVTETDAANLRELARKLAALECKPESTPETAPG